MTDETKPPDEKLPDYFERSNTLATAAAAAEDEPSPRALIDAVEADIRNRAVHADARDVDWTKELVVRALAAIGGRPPQDGETLGSLLRRALEAFHIFLGKEENRDVARLAQRIGEIETRFAIGAPSTPEIFSLERRLDRIVRKLAPAGGEARASSAAVVEETVRSVARGIVGVTVREEELAAAQTAEEKLWWLLHAYTIAARAADAGAGWNKTNDQLHKALTQAARRGGLELPVAGSLLERIEALGVALRDRRVSVEGENAVSARHDEEIAHGHAAIDALERALGATPTERSTSLRQRGEALTKLVADRWPDLLRYRQAVCIAHRVIDQELKLRSLPAEDPQQPRLGLPDRISRLVDLLARPRAAAAYENATLFVREAEIISLLAERQLPLPPVGASLREIVSHILGLGEKEAERRGAQAEAERREVPIFTPAFARVWREEFGEEIFSSDQPVSIYQQLKTLVFRVRAATDEEVRLKIVRLTKAVAGYDGRTIEPDSVSKGEAAQALSALVAAARASGVTSTQKAFRDAAFEHKVHLPDWPLTTKEFAGSFATAIAARAREKAERERAVLPDRVRTAIVLALSETMVYTDGPDAQDAIARIGCFSDLELVTMLLGRATARGVA